MTLEDLISKGYFPRELPPPFNTKEFAAKYNLIKNILKGAIANEPSRCVTYSIAKIGLIRKLIQIPNPMHQAKLCEVIIDNWIDIEKIYKHSNFSFSRPKISGDRAANPGKFKDFLRKGFLTSYSYNYELKTDISKYYPTIYTHSIPWAMHGKSVAKKSPKKNTLLGNKIDECVRQTMYGQTIGLPIGPDTSLIISELIGCSIDTQLMSLMPGLKGYRYIDDMYFYFHSLSDAESGLLQLQRTLKEYELQINAEKTKIRKLPIGIEQEWAIHLRAFIFRETEFTQYNDIISFFSMSFDLANKFPNEYVLSYTIEKIKRINLLSDKNYELLETMFLKTMIAEPSTIKEVFRFLFTYHSKADIKKIEKVLFDFIIYHCQRANDYELSWALWIAKTFKIKIPKIISELLSKSEDVISNIITLDLLHSSLIERADLDISSFESKLDELSLMDENWLLSYEIACKKWLGRRAYSYINNVPYFKILRHNKISFYDETLQIEPIELNKSEKSNEPKVRYTDGNEKNKPPIKKTEISSTEQTSIAGYSFDGDNEDYEDEANFVEYEGEDDFEDYESEGENDDEDYEGHDNNEDYEGEDDNEDYDGEDNN